MSTYLLFLSCIHASFLYIFGEVISGRGTNVGEAEGEKVGFKFTGAADPTTAAATVMEVNVGAAKIIC
jgi:hypothetical protein